MSIALLVDAGFKLWRQPYIGVGPGIGAAWLGIALVAILVGRRSERHARATALTIPLADMPALFLLQYGLVVRLQAAGFTSDATVNAAFTTGLFAVLIFLTTGLFGRERVVLVTLVAVLLQTTLDVIAHVDATVATFSAVTLVFAGVLSAVASERVFAWSGRRCTSSAAASASDATSRPAWRRCSTSATPAPPARARR